MSERKGTISVQTSDIFPIIKKWLYSEHDIFLRELVSNATDAITKRGVLARTKNQEIPDGNITIAVSKDKNIIQISDNGLGMSEEEVEKYIAQLAFSGAAEFVDNMKKEDGESGADIIGKFGLGFYSVFMVAEKVEVETLSWNEGSKPTIWTCEGETDYTFTESTKTEVGTTITLHLNEDGKEFNNHYKLTEILKKFCDFMPYNIEVADLDAKAEKPKKEDGTVDEEAQAVLPTPTTVNDTEPLWKKDPSTLEDKDYIEFYKKLFPMEAEPLFWLHLRVDHPFTLEGILYFPKINPKMPMNEQNIRLFSKQVFVSDNVKNIIPDFLGLLKGVIDSSDIPLNVSRSSLQGDPNIRRISNYVVKKVAESLKKLFRNDRERFEAIWQDIGLFVKYGCVSDEKFDELMREMVIFQNSEDKFTTLPEYRETIPAAFKEKLGDKVIYFEDGKSDISLKTQLLAEGVHTLKTENHIDPHFMQHVEYKPIKDVKWQFTSLDSEISNLLESENTNEDDMKIKDLFQKVLVGETKEDEKTPSPLPSGIDIEIHKFKNGASPAYFKVDEQMKRFAQMTQSMGQGATIPLKKTLVINPNNSLIQNALKIHEKGANNQLVEKLCHHVEDLANISSEGLKPEDKEAFVVRSQDLISELTNLAL